LSCSVHHRPRTPLE